MANGLQKFWDTYAMKKNAPFYLQEFCYFCLDRWIQEGHIDPMDQHEDYDKYLYDLFGFDYGDNHRIDGLGWTEASLIPAFEEKQIEDRGEHEVVQDFAGRHVLFFKGRRSGFMPEYIDHPVKDMKTWEENCKWRLNPNTPRRVLEDEQRTAVAVAARKEGKFITQTLIGGYMYLRSLIGPEDLLYKFYDEPALIVSCMDTWFHLADTVLEKRQQSVDLDEIFIGEDICYNGGSLISPDMVREFLFPYYQQLLQNAKKRQKDKTRVLHFQVDTDGRAEDVIELYQEVGMDVMSPFEVASGSDVVKIGQKYPSLIITGGIDKRILASTKEEIDRHLDYILPAMYQRGGYIPTCDHGVPEEVPFENYLHFRKKVAEYAK